MQQSLFNPLSLFSLWSALVRVSLTVRCLFHVSRDIPGDKHNLKHLKQEHITHILKMVRNSTCLQPTQAKVGNQICPEFQTPFWKVKLVTLAITRDLTSTSGQKPPCKDNMLQPNKINLQSVENGLFYREIQARTKRYRFKGG